MSFLDLLRLPDQAQALTPDGDLPLHPQQSTSHWHATGIDVVTSPNAAGLEVRLSADRPVMRIRLTWHARITPGLLYQPDHWERGYGDLQWHQSPPAIPMPWYFLTFDGERTHSYGVQTQPAAFCAWSVTSGAVHLDLDVRSGGVGVELAGRQLSLAQVISRRGSESESPFQAARAFCLAMCGSPRLPAQPVYGGNNWYYAYGNSSHAQILDDTRRIVGWSPDGPNRPFMVIDDGWQLCEVFQHGGPWHQGNRLFPDMPGLAAEMRKLGARPGIWHRPLCTSEKLPANWFLHRPNFGGAPEKVLDPTIPEVLHEVATDIARLSQWGYELIKHDFTTFDLLGRWGFDMGQTVTSSGWRFADTSRTTAEIILRLYRTIRQAAGDRLVLGCNTVGHLAAGLVDIQRTGDDTSGREWDRTRKMGINTLAFRMCQHDAFFAADADCVGLTSQIPWKLNHQWLQLLAASGTPLFVSADASAAGPEQEAALKAAFALAAQPLLAGEPLDWLTTLTPSHWKLAGKEHVFNWQE